ncbi:MAG: PAS domain-containing protein [Candidatus Marinimicrobia bacterium]|nr:PAS domain-containing protein [Candidatus Neomarinimicrobiota bacterium]
MRSKIKDYETTVLILESISDGVFILNKEGKIEYANRSVLNMLEVKFDEIRGKIIDEFIMDADEGEFEEQEDFFENKKRLTLIDKLSSGIFTNIECYLVNGQKVNNVLISFSPIKNSDGEVDYIIMVIRDITEFKAMEKELRRNQVIAVSRDRLRALGELTVGLIHQISHPINAMNLRLELLKNKLKEKGKLPKDKLLSFIDDFERMIGKMTGIVNSMRLFAQQTEGNILELVSIQDVVDNLVKIFSYELRNLGIELKVEHRDSLPFILANPLLIEQVLINLISNARDAFIYNPKRRDEIKYIKIMTRVNPGKWIEIYVEDNAGGIDKSIINKIWEPFFTTKEVDKNTGIGLTMCKNIINSMGGDIKVGVREGEGTTFKVILPLEQRSESSQLRNLIEILHKG